MGLALAGPFLILASLAPLPGPFRAIFALGAVLIGLPLAWAGLAGKGHAWSDRGAAAGPAVDLMGRLIVAATLPAVLWTALGLAGAPVRILVWVFAALQAGLSALALIRAGRERRVPGSRRPGSWWAAGLLLILAFVTLLAVRNGTPMGDTDDSYDHLASLRHLMESDRVEFPGAFHGRDQVEGLDPRKGVLLTALAMAGRLARSDATDIWRWSAVVMTPLAVLAYFALGLAVFRRPWAALLGLLVLVTLWADPLWLLRVAYGGHWGLVVAWAALAGFLNGGGARWGIIAGLSSAGVHAYSPVQVLAPLLVFMVLERIRPGDGPRIRLSVPGGFLVGSLPLEAVRWVLAGGTDNPLHDQSMEWLLLSPGPVASPLQLLGWYGYYGALAAVFVIAVVPFVRSRAAAFTAATLLAPGLVLPNPWLFGFVSEHFGSVANKLALVWAYPLAIAWMGQLALGAPEPGGKRPGPLRAVSGASLGLVLLLALGPLDSRVFAWRSAGRPGDEAATLATLVRRSTPEDAVVAADPMTSYAIPALTGRRVIATLHQHSPPGDARAPERLTCVAALFSACVPLESALRWAGREGARFVVVRLPARKLDQFGNHQDPRNREWIDRRFSAQPRLLERVDGEAGISVYRIRSEDPRADGNAGRVEADVHGLPPVLEPPPDSLSHLSVDGPGITVAVSRNLPGRAGRGESFSLPAAWRRREAAAGLLEHRVHLRFEKDDLPRWTGMARLIAKPLRRLVLEPRRGGSYRWRFVELPFRGLCPSAFWPRGQWLSDSLEITVPPQLLPGTYVIRVSLETGTLYPRLSPADILLDEDRFAGPVLGTLEIE